MLKRSDLFLPELIAALCRRQVSSPSSPFPQRGAHASRLRGSSLEFSEHTEYSPGDDLKHLDWKVFAKTDRYYVRRYEDERLARAVVVVDASNSMRYGEEEEGGLKGSKFHTACQLAVALSTMLARQGDAAGLSVAAKEPLLLLPKPGSAQVNSIADVLLNCRVGGDRGVSEAVVEAALKLRRNSTLYIISDFLTEGDETLHFLGGLKARQFNLGLIQVLHPDELVLPFDKPLRFLDLELDAQASLDPDNLRAAYVEEMKTFVNGLKAKALSLGAGHCLIYDPLHAAARLAALLARSEPGRVGDGVA